MNNIDTSLGHIVFVCIWQVESESEFKQAEMLLAKEVGDQ